MIGSRTIEYIIAANDQATRTLNKIDAALAANEKSFAKVRAAGMTLSVVGAAASAAVIGLANSAGRLEQLQVAFTTMLGSAEKAQKTLQDLSLFAAKTPFTLPGVERSAQQLLAVGYNAEELIPTLKMVGDVAAGLSLGEDGLQRLIINLGQVKTQGHLTGRELRDFAVNGVPLIQALADSLGVTKEKISELTSEGAISERMVTAAFQKMTGEGGRFGNMMDKQSKTFVGAVSNMYDSITLLGRQLGQPLIGPLTTAAQKVAALAQQVGEFQKKNPVFAELAAKVLLAVAAIASLTGGMLLAVGAVTRLFGVITVLNGGLQILVGVLTELRIAAMYGAAGLGLVVSPLLAIIAIAGAAVAALTAVLVVLNKIRGAQAEATAAISAEYQKQSDRANDLAAAQDKLTGKAKESAQLQEKYALDLAQVQNAIAGEKAAREAGASAEVIANYQAEIAAAEQRSARSGAAVRNFASTNKKAMSEVSDAMGSMQNASEIASAGFSEALGGAGDAGSDNAKKVADAMVDMEDTYHEKVSEIQQDLSELELAHTEKMNSIKEKIDDVAQSMQDLRDKYAATMSGIGADIAETVVDQEQKVADLKEKMNQFTLSPNALGTDQMISVIENRMDKMGQFADKLSSRDIREFNLKDGAVDQINTLLQLQQAQEALTRMQKEGVASEDALTEARRRAGLSDNERRIEDLQKRAEEETAEFDKKMANYEKEKQALIDQQTTAQQVYEAQRNQLQLTLTRMQALHDGYVLLLTQMDDVTADKVIAMKQKLEELKSAIDQINALLKAQGEAGIQLSPSIVNAGERGLQRAERAYGGMADGLTLVGEQGPELLRLPRGSHVTDAGTTRRTFSEETVGGITIAGPLIGTVHAGSNVDIKRAVQEALEEAAKQVRLKRIRQS